MPTLNDPKKPFACEVRGDTISGSCDIVRATMLYPTQVETIDKNYQITGGLLLLDQPHQGPLFTFLEQHGWHRKKGLLSGLFNR